MRTLEQRLSYEKLELIQPPKSWATSSVIKSVRSLFTQFGNTVVRALTMAEEPQIWTHADTSGSLVWYVRHPLANHIARFDSEQDVRVWLEERRYLD